MSGTEFFDACGGNLGTLYLNDWLAVRKDLLPHVKRMVPMRDRQDTLEGSDRESSGSENGGGEDHEHNKRAKKKAKVLDRIVCLLRTE